MLVADPTLLPNGKEMLTSKEGKEEIVKTLTTITEPKVDNKPLPQDGAMPPSKLLHVESKQQPTLDDTETTTDCTTPAASLGSTANATAFSHDESPNKDDAAVSPITMSPPVVAENTTSENNSPALTVLTAPPEVSIEHSSSGTSTDPADTPGSYHSAKETTESDSPPSLGDTVLSPATSSDHDADSERSISVTTSNKNKKDPVATMVSVPTDEANNDPVTTTTSSSTDTNVLTIVYNGQIRHVTLLRDKNIIATSAEFEDLLKAAFCLDDSSTKLVGFAATKTGEEGVTFVTLGAMANGKLDESISCFELLAIEKDLSKKGLQDRAALLVSGDNDDDDDRENWDDKFTAPSVSSRDHQFLKSGDLSACHDMHASTHSAASISSTPAKDVKNGDRMSVVDFLDILAVLEEQGELDQLSGKIISDFVESNNCKGEVLGPLKVAVCIAEWAKDKRILTSALTSLSDTIVLDQDPDASDGVHLSMTNMDFLLEAAETAFLETHRETTSAAAARTDPPLAPGQLWALQDAILHSHPSLVAIYEAYRKTLERAFDMDITLNGGGASSTSSAEDDECMASALDFLLHALKRVAQSLEPIEQGVSTSIDGVDEAPEAGLEDSMEEINELSSMGEILEAVVVDLPDSLQQMAYELLMESDVYLLDALKAFVIDGDVFLLQDKVMRRLKLRLETTLEMEGSLLLRKDDESERGSIDIPKSLIVAAATLVEHERVSDEAAASLVSKFALGDEAVKLVFEYFSKTGDLLTFIQQLELLSGSDENSLGLCTGPYDDALAKSVFSSFHDLVDLPLEKEDALPGSVAEDEESVAIREVISALVEDFTPLEVQALKVSLVKCDPLIDEAMETFRDSGNLLQFRLALLAVANDTIADTRIKMARRKVENAE